MFSLIVDKYTVLMLLLYKKSFRSLAINCILKLIHVIVFSLYIPQRQEWSPERSALLVFGLCSPVKREMLKTCLSHIKGLVSFGTKDLSTYLLYLYTAF